MRIYQKEIQKELLKYGSLTEAMTQNGVLATIDFAISTILGTISKRFYKPTATDFGFPEAIFWARSID